jgi:hypothetical protein
MKYKGKITKDQFSIQSIDLEQFILIIFEQVQTINFIKLTTMANKLDQRYWKEIGLPINIQEDMIFFDSKDDLKNFLGVDRIFEAKAKLYLSDQSVYELDYHNKSLILTGENIAKIKDYFFPLLPHFEGNYILKKGLFFNFIQVEQLGQERISYLFNARKLKKVHKNNLFFQTEFYKTFLFLCAYALIFIFLKQKPIFIGVIIILNVLIYQFLYQFKKKRFIKDLWNIQKQVK